MYNTPYHTKDLSKFNFLVTGGAGFIGSNLVEYLLKYEAKKVRVLDNFETGYIENISEFLNHPSFDLIEGEFIREVEPGELLLINKDGLKSYFPFQKTQTRQCVFEHIYFSRPDSYLFNKSVYETRKEMGRALAQEHPADADIVVPQPTIDHVSKSRHMLADL